LELELLVVPSCVIPRQICGGVLGSHFFSFEHGELEDLRKKVLEERQSHKRGIRRKRKGKVMYVKV
jgi:hypothetical protein